MSTTDTHITAGQQRFSATPSPPDPLKNPIARKVPLEEMVGRATRGRPPTQHGGPAELDPLTRIYALLPLQTDLFSPQQTLVEKHREGALATNATTSHRRRTRGSWPTKRVPNRGRNRSSPTVRAARGDVRFAHAAAHG